jgi:hypothetical protein
MSIIDTFGSPVNITGTPLGVQLLFADKGSQTQTVHSLMPYEAVLNLPSTLLTLLQTPLSQFGDQVWSQNKDKHGQTMRDRVSALVSSGIVTQVKQLGHTAYNISVSLPATGILRALVVDGTAVYLSYEINGNSAAWDVNVSIWPFSDASYSLTFDLELLIEIVIPDQAGFLLTTTASANVENANISGTDASAAILDFAGEVANFLTDQPTNIFQSAEGEIDSAGSGVAVDLGDLSTLLAAVPIAWLQALPYGFTQLTALIQQQEIFMQFGHPQDPAPVVGNAAIPTYPGLLPPEISTDHVVNAGSSPIVTGANFPLDQASAIYVGWQDTTSGTVTESDINWGQAGGPTQSVTIPRNGNDGKNLYITSNLAPNSTYDFSVRDQDFLTETPFSPPFSVTTTTNDLVEFNLVLGGQQWNVGSTTLTTTGSFSASITIPPGQAPGAYNLVAMLGGTQLATTPLQVEGVGQPLPTNIQVEYAPPNSPANLIEGSPFTLILQGFLPGTVSVFVDSPAGQMIGTTTSTSTSTFTAPFVWPAVEGAHNVYAQDFIATQPPATCPVFGSPAAK